VFFAKIVCDDDQKQLEIDSRPSDAIAIGLRFSAPIYTYENILAEAGIVLSEESEENLPETSTDIPPPTKSADPKKEKGSLKDYSMDKLNKLLEKAIQMEDYEWAAKIRDEINRRN
jgi:bifunctional DNase/RNase